MNDELKEQLLEVQTEEECVTEEAIVYDNEFEDVKEVQIEEEIEDEPDEEQAALCDEELDDDLDDELDDSDKEMVVDDQQVGHSEDGDDDSRSVGSANSADNESDARSENSETNNDRELRLPNRSLVRHSYVSRFDIEKESTIIHHPNDSWAHFTGLKVKHFTPSELEAFKKPFEMGWRREVVLRGTVTNSGKKIGDVYYFSPDKKVKLRSYVEMGLYLKRHQNCDLEPENFTFARQPIYKAPEEIVRHAMQRGGSHGQFQASLVDSSVVPGNANAYSTTVYSSSRSTKSANSASDSGTEDKSGISSVAEGRAKRKRVAPSRFEDEDYSEHSPFKKKGKHLSGLLSSCGTPILPPSIHAKTPHIKVTLANKSSLLAHPSIIPRKSQGQTILQMQPQPSQHLVVTGMQQLSNLHNEQRQQQKQNASQQPALQTNQSVDQLPSSAENSTNSHLSVAQVSAKKSISGNPSSKVPVLRIKMANFKPIKPKPQEGDRLQAASNDTNGNIECDSLTPLAPSTHNTAPCSIMCNGRRGVLPSLLCSRCLCLFHRECVPSGIYLREPHQFVCPNCIQPADKENQQQTANPITVNGVTSGGDNENVLQAETLSKLAQNKTSLSPIVNSNSTAPAASSVPGSQRLHPPRGSFAPILPKPQATQQQVICQQNHLQSQLQLIQHFQQQQRNQKQLHQDQQEQQQHQESLRKHKSSACPAMDVKLPAGTQLYRVPGPSHPITSNSNLKATPLVPNCNSSLRENAKSVRKSHGSNPSGLSQSHSMPFQPIAPIAPIAPIKVTPSQVASFLQQQQQQQQQKPQKSKREYKEYLLRHNSGFSKLTQGYVCLNEVMKYMTVRDLIRLKQVNKLFHQLASQSFLWQKICLKGIKIVDWQSLGRNVVEPNSSTEIDFENIRCSPNADLCETWRNFDSIIDFLRSVKHLKFGTIPTFVIEDLLNAAVTENCYNSFSTLETLVARNVFEEDSKLSQCNLNFLQQIGFLPQLQTLHLESKQGFAGDESSADLLNEAFATLPGLRTLIIPCIKGFTVEQFHFLTKLKNLEHLEIGSCESWTAFEDSEEEVGKEEPSEGLQPKIAEPNGAFKYLSELTKLRKLKLVDVIIDHTSNQLSMALQKMANLNSLSLECVTISPDATETLNYLCTTIKTHLHDLKHFSVSTDDAHTNKCIFELLKKLDTLSSITWKVGALVEDSGECYVQFVKERGDESEMEGENVDLTNGEDRSEMMDMTFLSETLQVELPKTRVTIVPQ